MIIASLRGLIKKMRSRRLAVWLLAASAAWSFLGTVVPQTARDAAGVQAWALEHPILETIVNLLGLHHAFRAPIFLAVVAVLAVSTSLCAWERTAWAGRTLSRTRSGVVPRAAIEQHAHITIAVPSAIDLGAAEDAVRGALRRMRLRVSSVDGVIEGGSRRWSVFGSPVFHWALALLMIVIGVGQLTRSEGLMGVPEKEIVLDTAEAYGVLTEGPWFTGHSGYGIGITEFERYYNDGTVDRGASPVVTLYDGDLALVSQRIYPNQPLRYKAMMIHMSEWGYAPEVGSTTAAGESLGSLKMIVDVEEGMPRSTTSGFDITSPTDGSTLEFSATLVVHEGGPQLELIGSDLNGEEVARAQLGVGEELTLPNGDRVEYQELHYYARLSVVHDWSVSFIYLLFILGLAGVSVAVLDPHRRIAVVVGESQDEPNALAVRVLIRHGRRSALFVERVNEVIEASLSAAAEDVSTERDRS